MGNMDIIILILLAVVIGLLIVILIKMPERQGKGSAQEPSAMLLMQQNISELRRENAQTLRNITQELHDAGERGTHNHLEMMQNLTASLGRIQESNLQSGERQGRKLDEAIRNMQESNEKKLEEMRRTVDEKLTETLNTRLNASFKTVSEQLSNVYQSLGEMKELSGGVTDSVRGLNRVLTNVKARGIWAEAQLEEILNETIPGMYDKNVATNPKSTERVEFAVRIPSASENGGFTYLPIDSKFPMEDYARLTAASENGNILALEEARKALVSRIRDEAKAVSKYINLPDTTPFAILYLATEGLYAEAYSAAGLPEKLRADYHVMLAGPSTITAILNSLAMGFRSIAINRKADEVWKVLGAAKGQYEKFGELLGKAINQIDRASKTLQAANDRNRIIQNKLRGVEALQDSEEAALGIPETAE